LNLKKSQIPVFWNSYTGRLKFTYIAKKQIWFLITEIYNNKILFERTLKAIYPLDWDEKSKGLMKWLESQISHITMLWE
jgi:hypothetical protein